jgi:hypothetical protein
MLECMNKKITTIGDLAVMIEGEFRGIEKRFDALEVQIDRMAREIKEVRVDVKTFDTRSALINLELRVSKLERKV